VSSTGLARLPPQQYAAIAGRVSQPQLQRANRAVEVLGNQARLLTLSRIAPRLQAKLEIGAVNDPLEREADAVADTVMRATSPPAAFSPAPVAVHRKCAACEEEDGTVQRKQDGAVADVARGVPESVQQILHSPGRTLDPDTRAFFEPRFGVDFSGVRVHDDDRAAQSARDVGAHAYAVSNHVAFAAGRFNPKTSDGRRLLAHELAHTVQQRAALPVLQRDEAIPTDTGKAADTATCLVHFVQGSTEFTDAKEFAACMASIKAYLAADASRSVELNGFASEEGDDKFNADLAQRRADTVKNLLVTGGVAAAKLTATGHGADKTYAKLEDNRRVEIPHPAPVPPPPPIQVPEQKIATVACPPTSTVTAADLGVYVELMKCAETKMGLSTREMLTMFRQIYYGKPWSVSTNAHWDEVITCPANVGDPRPKLGTPLFESLKASQEVNGVDVGHVFAGLEAMMCPTPDVKINATGQALGLTTVNTANEDFATWGGDLGAAVAARAACERLGAAAATKEDCGKVPGPRELIFYLRLSAPDQDLQGDIDPFAMRAQMSGIACGGSRQKTATLPAKKMSEIFDDYYNDPGTALGKAHTNAVHCFLDAIGAQLDAAGKKITNRAAIAGPMSVGVESFAEAFYYKIRGTTADTGESSLMKIVYSRDAVDWFLTWLEKHLP
jgi:outer membrane protein OmpA-like peptidoglycan-associated protein